jgi:murein DD-endopeptidase MepM/ murein hydrolase activator NlpD
MAGKVGSWDSRPPRASRHFPRIANVNLRPFGALVILATMGGACAPSQEIVPAAYAPRNDRDAYERGLRDAGLAGTALGMEWQRAADNALSSPGEIDLPYREQGLFDRREAHAFGYRFRVDRGQRVEAELRMSAPDPRVFVDLYRIDEGQGRVHVASVDPGSRLLRFEPRADAEYILRVQPELMRGGSYDLEIRRVEALEFPVAEHSAGDIQSPFGAPRDAGRRSHHGVDIFAPRGTPVVATSHAFVRRVRVQNLGGKTVWLHDRERGLHLYYAHLDEQLVEPGTWVRPGDIIGRVGNTGNARTTPPHLHFGIYAQGEGPIDPDPFLRAPRQRPARQRADPGMAGSVAEVGDGGSPLRAGPSGDAAEVALLPEGTPLRVWAAAGDRYRITLEDGTPGFVSFDRVRRAPDAGGASN